MAGPHRCYSYPRQGTRSYLVTETPQRFEISVSNVLDLGVPIVSVYSGGECPPRCTSYYGTTLDKTPISVRTWSVGDLSDSLPP